jgi:hypothetical protein
MPDATKEPQNDRRRDNEERDDETVSYYDYSPDRLFKKYLQGDENAGRKALEEIRREVESDLREARL